MNKNQARWNNEAHGLGGAARVRILHLEDSRADADLIRSALDYEGLPCEITHVKSQAGFEMAVERGQFDLILCDHNIPGYDGFTALEFAKKQQPHIPVIILSGSLDDVQAVQSLKSGATDYILKESLARLVPAIRRALVEAEERRKQAAAEAQIREQANLLNLTRDAIMVRNMEDRIAFWNAGSEALFGWTAAQAFGQDFGVLLHGDLAQISEARESLLQLGDWMGEIQLKGKDGKEITVLSRWNLLRGQDGQPQAILSTNTDITEKKKLESVLLRAQRMDSIGALAGGIAHDLNNAMAPILMSAELLENCEDKTSRRRYVDVIGSSARRATGMVKQILTFARGRSGQAGPVAVSQLVREMEKMVRDTFSKSIAISINASEKELWKVQGDLTELHQVLLNLCVNARDAMPGGGRLAISAQNTRLDREQAAVLHGRPGPHVMVSVADSGSGIPPEVLPRIFEPFFSTKGPDKGTGLGLSTVSSIIRHHGGCMDVKTELGKGTEFKIYLPAVEYAEAAETKQEKAPLPVGRGEMILVIEDEEALRELTKATLENYGYRTVTAQNGLQGIALFEEHRQTIKLVVTDTDMPEMSGLSAVRAMRETRPDLPIILASGSKQTPEDSRRIEAEHMTNLGKPFSLEQLLVGVAQAIKT